MRRRMLLALLAVALPTAALATSIVTNGSFETGDFSGWSTGNFDFTDAVVSGPFYKYTSAQDGIFYAVLGNFHTGTLQQSLTTHAGTLYTVTFYLAAVGDNPSDFSASWDGVTLFSTVNPDTGGVWTKYTFDVKGTGSDTLGFAFFNQPAWTALDNISVTPTTVPEPSVVEGLLLGISLLSLAEMTRRKLRLGT